MGFFPEDLIIRCIPKEESRFRFMVHGYPFKYITSNGEIVEVPVGFKTDFASVPWVFRRLIPAIGRYNEAAVIHDYLCYLSNKGLYDRRKADNVFVEAMETLGVNTVKIKLISAGVKTYTKLRPN